MMPLLIFVYARPQDDDAPKMNYLAIVVTLIVATTPAVLGWRLRRTPEGAGKATETWRRASAPSCWWPRASWRFWVCRGQQCKIKLAALLHASDASARLTG